MTPEEAIPDTIEIAILAHQESIDKGENPPLWFTAKETAEIARAYATAFYKEQRCEETGAKGMGENAPKWRELFKEWSK